MPSPFLQCRVPREVREQAEQAAEDCSMTVGAWLREIVQGALVLHFGIDVASSSRPGVVYHVDAGGCTCPAFVNRQTCRHLSLLYGREELEPTKAELAHEAAAYEETLELGVTELRDELRADARNHPPGPVEHPGQIEIPESRISPRDCVHPRTAWSGGLCGRCGIAVGGSARMGRIPLRQGGRR